MAENNSHINGPVPMVKIDGDKIRRVREEKGLTQLYLATAVGVTTDTISRWENRRYPSIKKENGIRLAEALEVDLADLLECAEEAGSRSLQDNVSSIPGGRPAVDRKRAVKHLVLGCFLFLAVIVVGGIWLIPHRSDELLVAYRVLPQRSAPGIAFPVVIELLGPVEESQSIIVKELLPSGAKVLQASPRVTATGESGRELKWLQKVQGRTRFTYLMKFISSPQKDSNFTGSVSVGQGGMVAIQGKNSLVMDRSHWADQDGNGAIDDPEILYVYDQFGDIEGIDFGTIEKIWAASGYRWNKEMAEFEVLSQ